MAIRQFFDSATTKEIYSYKEVYTSKEIYSSEEIALAHVPKDFTFYGLFEGEGAEWVNKNVEPKKWISIMKMKVKES